MILDILSDVKTRAVPADLDLPSLVREIRRRRGLTQEQLARELEVTFGTVNGWERGRHRPIRALLGQLVDLAVDSGIDPESFSRAERHE